MCVCAGKEGCMGGHKGAPIRKLKRDALFAPGAYMHRHVLGLPLIVPLIVVLSPADSLVS